MQSARQLLFALTVLFCVATLTFFLLRVLPGDAISAQLLQSGAGPDAIAQARAQLGLDASLGVQYGRFMAGLVRGDMGQSLVSGQPVTMLIGQQLIPTVTLALWAILVAVLLGLSTGISAAFDGRISWLARLAINLSLSAPIYWTGTLAIVVFAAQLGWLPSTGTGRPEHLILPVSVLAFHTMGGIGRVVQVNVRHVREAAYIRTAQSKGLTRRIILIRHTLRAGLPPIVTVIALQTGFLLSGAVITESLFVRPGLGRLLLRSVLLQDYPVVQGVVIVSALAYLSMNALADFLHRLIDPRLSL